jgi:hypothetical protein
MKKHARRLTLNRETILRLDEMALRRLKGGATGIAQDSQEPACYSPWCGPTFWQTCDTQTA